MIDYNKFSFTVRGALSTIGRFSAIGSLQVQWSCEAGLNTGHPDNEQPHQGDGHPGVVVVEAELDHVDDNVDNAEEEVVDHVEEEVVNLGDDDWLNAVGQEHELHILPEVDQAPSSWIRSNNCLRMHRI